VSAVTQAARNLFGNTNSLAPVSEAWSMQNPVLYTLIWVVVILAIFVPFSVALYKRAARK
jgi:ABC-2 type transport system permease protein